MRVLLVTHHFPPDIDSTGLLMAQLADELARRGHDVTVLTTVPHSEGFRIRPDYSRRLVRTKRVRGIKVVRVWSYTSKKGRKPMRRRMLNSLTFSMTAAFFGLFRVRRRDIVFTTNGSLFAGLAGFFLATFKGGKFIYNVQDLYPEVPIIQGQLRKRRSIWLFGRVQRTMYGLADHISVITPSFKSNLMAKGVDEDKISIIPNFVDVGFIRPTAKSNGFSRTQLLEDKFVVSHSGSMGYVYDLDMLIEAAQRLRDDDDVMFVFVGDGVHKRRLQKRADALQLVNVCFLPFQPYRDLPRIRGASDVQVALYRTAAATYSMPHKVYEIMASGRPILASAEQGSDLEQLVNECECGFCVNPGDTEGLVAAITKLKENPALAEDMGRTGRQRAETTYSKSIVVDAYEELFRGQTGDG